MLTDSERKRLIAILGMLGSEHDGEKAAAATQAEAFRRKHGMTWAELLAASQEAPQAPPRPSYAYQPPPYQQPPEPPRPSARQAYQPPPRPEPNPAYEPPVPQVSLGWRIYAWFHPWGMICAVAVVPLTLAFPAVSVVIGIGCLFWMRAWFVRHWFD